MAFDNQSQEGEDVPSISKTTRFRDLIRPISTQKIEVEYFSNDKSFKQRLQFYFIRNQRTSLCIRLIKVFLKLLSCVLYVIRVVTDTGALNAKCYGCPDNNLTDTDLIAKQDYLTHPRINYLALLWVSRSFPIWLVQVFISFFSIIERLLFIYASYKGNIWQVLLSLIVLLELATSVPFLVTLCLPMLRNLFVPMFLNCWLAKWTLNTLMNDLNRAIQKSHSAVSQQIIVLGSTFACLVFTGACGIQHIQRAGRQSLTFFQSFYFIVVTFSTVGYGDIYPDMWLSQLFTIFMICVAFVVLPKQVEQLALTWMEKQKSGGEYSSHRAKSEKHVVVCTTYLRADTILDFLNEFYAHPMLQDYFVLLMSPCDLDTSMRMLIQIPLWSQRVIYIKGSTLKDGDLERVRLNDANACFILAARNYSDKNAADQHTILRSWAVRDFAPKCPQYVQIFRPENKIHVKHAEYVVCEDEFKYAILANNCICPGISTFITLLLHTSRGLEGQQAQENWQKIYGRHSGNEIYHMKVHQSKLLKEFIGKSFTYASFHAHRKYGIGLVAVQKDKSGSTIQLNPGPRHILKSLDVCYYMSITEEGQMTLVTRDVESGSKRRKNISQVASQVAGTIGAVALEVQNNNESQDKNENILRSPSVSRRPSIAAVPETVDGIFHHPTSDDNLSNINKITEDLCSVCGTACEERDYTKGFPPVTPYIGTSATMCHLLKQRRPLCCLQLAQACEHCSYKNASQYHWRTPAIILAADHASNGIYNFIIPLRTHFRPSHNLNPIILLLEQKPELAFMDSISHFPLIYWMLGKIENIDHLLKAGINLSEHVVVANKENSNSQEDDYLADCNTIVAVQTMFRLFPQIRIITELTHSSNMRFMQFNAKDMYALFQSKIEKKEREGGSNMAFMFRLPFAAGNVFSATMLDTLLYQAFIKDYLIQFVRLLLGIDQALGSGYLTSILIREEDLWLRTYGRLYQKLCSTEGDLPIGIYRTHRMDKSSFKLDINLAGDNESSKDIFQRKFSCKYLVSERHEITNLVKNRMDNLGLPTDTYISNEKRGYISFVIINPSADLKLEAGDLVYVLRPSFRALKGIERSPISMKVLSKDKVSRSSHSVAFSENVANDKQIPQVTITSCTPSQSTNDLQPTANSLETQQLLTNDYHIDNEFEAQQLATTDETEPLQNTTAKKTKRGKKFDNNK